MISNSNRLATWFKRFSAVAVCSCALGLVSLPSFSSEVIELEGIFVRGNQEQPKVLFIMPWQTDAELSGLKQEILPDLHRSNEFLNYFGFKRQVNQFHKNAEKTEHN